jgi:hypothetical protein
MPPTSGTDYVYSRLANKNIPGEFNQELNIMRDLVASLDLMYTNTNENDSVSSLVNSQYAKLKVEKDDLQKEIDSVTAKITAKETEFVDVKKNAGEAYIMNKLFTQQDYFTMMLFIAYIILSVSFYWRMTTTDGFTWKMLFYFILGWMIATTMLFRLFDRFV